MVQLTFRPLRYTDASAYARFRHEVLTADQDNPYSTNIVATLRAEDTFNTTLANLAADRHATHDDRVPQEAYFMFSADDTILGRVRCRLAMTPVLARTGGHIGYYVTPSQRGHGYARQLLQFALTIYRQRQEPFVIVTALVDNVASRKTIEACGGVLQAIVPEGADQLAIYHIILNHQSEDGEKNG
ncbi:GNAT family N-acetyltransferase [Schleiferilactobacillus shenzhenensis]|uniref:N-acetyltransferase domain-containing protein n=1 Tax=Schleiferilactobacillus shenzhenensis LY-73 TaxID=1231336 RepID=U4TVQ1_9LACO|nr:GNAT family N-acetyltransferase [Schleiferilactobacillus shenzhenensis]ERL65918.1 hypothetical protein L248_1994 [Schleiferilactobacillus shenzhenensis LY-73]